MQTRRKLVMVRGGGDLATGTVYKLYKSGFWVLVLETGNPTAIRRRVSLCEAVYDGSCRVEDMTGRLARTKDEVFTILSRGEIPVLVDPEAEIRKEIRPWALVDAILAKKNLGTGKEMAPRTIALGPGFCAGKDVDLVIETQRGHNLGRILETGNAAPDTGIPGAILGWGKERVIHAPKAGRLIQNHDIGDLVKPGEVVGTIESGGEKTEVPSLIGGVLRGILRDGFWVQRGMKMADVDPREEEKENCFTISDKARCIAGGVLEGLLRLDRPDWEEEV